MSALTPPHGPTLSSSHIVLEASPLLETVTWLVERVQDQHLSFERLQKELVALQSQNVQVQSSELEGAKTGAASEGKPIDAAQAQPEQGKAPDHRKVEGRAASPAAASPAAAAAAVAAASESVDKAGRPDGMSDLLSPRGTPAYQELQVDIVKLQRALEELQEEVQSDVHKLTVDVGACLQEENLQPLIDQQVRELTESFREELQQLRAQVQGNDSSHSGAGNADDVVKEVSETGQGGDAAGPAAVAASADAERVSSLEQRLEGLAAELAVVKEQNEVLAQAKENQALDPAAREEVVKQGDDEIVDSVPHSATQIQENLHTIERKLHIIFSAFGIDPENLQAGSLAGLAEQAGGAGGAQHLPHVSPSELADATARLTLRIEGLEERLGKLEELNSATAGGKGGYGGALAGAYERVSQLVDDADTKGISSAKAVADEALGTSASGGSGGSGDEPSASAAQLKVVMDDLKDLKQKYKTLSAQLSASLGSGTVEQVGAAASASDIKMQSAEGAALRAESAASAAQKLKDQLDEALQTIEEGRYRVEQQTAQDLEACTNQQRVMEDTLKRLEAQIQSDDPEIAKTLNAVVTDVRYCLKRCELLFQLPEIKVYIKRFQASLQMNAVLQDRWLGPAGREKKMFDDIGETHEEVAEETLLSSRPEHTQSTGDLPTAPGNKIGSKKNQGEQKKRPFRTVTDWARPHTPLSIDPVLRPPSRESRETGGLPQISPSKN